MSNLYDYDVAILGGGSAGLVAAIQAARLGARTLLIEKQGQLGGTTTVAAVTGVQSFFAYGQQVIAGIGFELVARTYEIIGRPRPNATPVREHTGTTTTSINPALFAAVADEAVLAAGARLRLHTMLAGIHPHDEGWRLTLCGKEGLSDVSARVVIDCSGDADAFVQAGLPVVRPAQTQPATLVFNLAGYDAAALDLDAIQAAFDAQVAAGNIPKTDAGWKHGDIRPLLQWHGGNYVHVLAPNTGDSAGRTSAELEGRRVMLRMFRFLRAQPGLENLTVSCAAECGIRETTLIQARKTITCEDYITGRLWPDAVCYSFYYIDMHTEDGVDHRTLPRGTFPTIPFGAMLPTQSRNILAAGRCISGDRLAFSAFRVQASCMAMGQAAGAAAALAARDRIDVADVPLPALRTTLTAHAAIVPPILTTPPR